MPTGRPHPPELKAKVVMRDNYIMQSMDGKGRWADNVVMKRLCA